MTKAADEVYAVLKRQFRGELLRPRLMMAMSKRA